MNILSNRYQPELPSTRDAPISSDICGKRKYIVSNSAAQDLKKQIRNRHTHPTRGYRRRLYLFTQTKAFWHDLFRGTGRMFTFAPCLHAHMLANGLRKVLLDLQHFVKSYTSNSGLTVFLSLPYPSLYTMISSVGSVVDHRSACGAAKLMWDSGDLRRTLPFCSTSV